MNKKSKTLGGAAAAAFLLLIACSTAPPPAQTGSMDAPAATPAAAEKAALPPIAVRPYVVPEGTALVVHTTTSLSTKTAETGQTFTATLSQPLVLEGETIAKKGAEVTGKIVESDDGGRVEGVAHIAVRLTSLKLDNGKVMDITTNSLSRQAKSTKKKDAVKVGVASGVGAAIGAIAGGGKGAAIGAGAGAGAGTGVVLATHGDPAVISSESVLKFTTTSTAEAERK